MSRSSARDGAQPVEPNSFPPRPVSEGGSKGHRVAEIAAVTSLGERWMEQFLER